MTGARPRSLRSRVPRGPIPPPRLVRAARALLLAIDTRDGDGAAKAVDELRAAVAEEEEGRDIASTFAESIAREHTGIIRRGKR